jgi:hypothetical protein
VKAWLSQADVATFAPQIASCMAMVGGGTAQEMIKRLWHPDLISRAVAFGFRVRCENEPRRQDVIKDMVRPLCVLAQFNRNPRVVSWVGE